MMNITTPMTIVPIIPPLDLGGGTCVCADSPSLCSTLIVCRKPLVAVTAPRRTRVVPRR